MNRLFGFLLLICGGLALAPPTAAAPVVEHDTYVVISLFTTINDVNTQVTSSGLTWKELADSAQIAHDGPAGFSGNQGGRWLISSETGLAYILNMYSAQGYELISYSSPTAILRKR